MRAAEELLTSPGSALGTVAYMSPEQARGEELDARTDLFSFGVVLYEMATGQRPFQGNTTAVVFDAILNKTPVSPVRLRPDLPAGLELIINKALEKDRDVRCQTASELRADLKRLKRDTESGKSAPQRPFCRRRRPAGAVLLLLAGVLIVIGIASAVAWFALRQPPPPPPELRERRLTANPADNPVTSAVISPDGKYLAYSDLGGIHLKLIATGETRTIPQTEGWTVTSWFPDGSKLLANGPNPENPGVWVISVLGGTPRKLQDHGSSGMVSPDGSQIAFADRVGMSVLGGFKEIWVMGPGGEEPRKIFTAKEGEVILQAAWSPDSSRIAYLRALRYLPASDALRPLKVSTSRPARSPRSCQIRNCWGFCRSVHFAGPLAGTSSTPARNPPPNAQDSNLWELRVNSNTGEPAGKPRKITHWSGTAVGSVNASADGRRLAVLKANFQMDVYIGQLEANGTRMKTPRRLTLDERNDLPGPWMPDSKTEIFSSDRNGNWDIFKQAIDQPSAEPLVTGPDDEIAKAVTPDGLWLLYTVQKQGDPSAPTKLMRVPISGGSPEFLLDAGVDFTTSHVPSVRHRPCASWQSEIQRGWSFPLLICPRAKAVNWPRSRTLADWDFFHDGSRIAVLIKDQGKSRIRIVRSSGETEREFIVERPGIESHLLFRGWKRSVPVGHAAARRFRALLHGSAGPSPRALAAERQFWACPFRPSPDGRYLAMTGTTTTSDAWLLENF